MGLCWRQEEREDWPEFDRWERSRGQVGRRQVGRRQVGRRQVGRRQVEQGNVVGEPVQRGQVKDKSENDQVKIHVVRGQKVKEQFFERGVTERQVVGDMEMKESVHTLAKCVLALKCYKIARHL